jgi:hypothetical protein
LYAGQGGTGYCVREGAAVEGFMRNAITGSLVIAAAVIAAAPLDAQMASSGQDEVERQFDAALNGAEMAGWMKIMAAEPNHVGSPHNKANAEMVLAQFKESARRWKCSVPSRSRRR